MELWYQTFDASPTVMVKMVLWFGEASVTNGVTEEEEECSRVREIENCRKNLLGRENIVVV